MIFQTVKKSWVRAILAGSLLTLPIFANAELPLNNAMISQTNHQIPSDESVEKLINLQQFDKAYEAQNQQEIESLQKSTANLLKKNALSSEKDTKAQKIYHDFIDDSIKELNSPSVKAQYKANTISAIKKVYNQQEVNAMIDFYGSPVGQKIIEKQNDFSAELMKNNLPIMQHWQEDLLKNKLPKLFRDLAKLKNEPTTK